MTKLRIIGDIHGNYSLYKKLVNDPNIDYSIQLGDFGYNYQCLDSIDPTRHFVIYGNHEDHSERCKYPHFLGNYGIKQIGTTRIFYLSGAYSIDRKTQEILGSWSPKEELSFEDLYRATLMYKDADPDILIAHEGPTEGIEALSLKGIQLEIEFPIKSPTQQTLQKMIQLSRPDKVFFGHWHQTGTATVKGTEYTCIGIDQYKDISV